VMTRAPERRAVQVVARNRARALSSRGRPRRAHELMRSLVCFSAGEGSPTRTARGPAAHARARVALR
jgi:hypothetical protein